jgi:hypothetical protein
MTFFLPRKPLAMKSTRIDLFTWIILGALFSCTAWAQTTSSDPADHHTSDAAQEFEWVIKPRFDDTGNFSANGLAPVKVNGKLGYIRLLQNRTSSQ